MKNIEDMTKAIESLNDCTLRQFILYCIKRNRVPHIDVYNKWIVEKTKEIKKLLD